MRFKRAILVGAMLVMTVLLSACIGADQDRPPSPGTALTGPRWVLVSLHGSAPIEGREITLSFEETSVEGSGGCNTYGGSYTASEDSLSLRGVYWTEMACLEPKGVMEQEQAYFRALNAAARYRVDGDRLELYDEAGAQILTFVAAEE